MLFDNITKSGLIQFFRNKLTTSKTITETGEYAADAKSVKDLQDEIDELTGRNAYSTTEKVVGTWMGKPLYRKSYVITQNINSSNYEAVDTGITIANMKLLINAIVHQYVPALDTLIMPVPYRINRGNTDGELTFTAFPPPSSGSFTLVAGSVIDVYYTKTTD